jgi:SAM-dependent methyltransferase
MVITEVSLPPFEYQTLVCGPSLEPLFENVGLFLLEMLKHQGMIGAGVDVLDVGCGCGRVARFLLDEPIGRYEGFDRHPGMIAWCNRELASRDHRFRFQHADVKSAYIVWDAQTGRVNADDFVFPYPDESFDSILLASVFTHMPLNEVRHYLHELRRVLRPAGRILLSIFLADGPAYITDEINFFFEPEQFRAAVSSAGLTQQALAPTPLFGGYHHNWYVLRRAR